MKRILLLASAGLLVAAALWSGPYQSGQTPPRGGATNPPRRTFVVDQTVGGYAYNDSTPNAIAVDGSGNLSTKATIQNQLSGVYRWVNAGGALADPIGSKELVRYDPVAAFDYSDFVIHFNWAAADSDSAAFFVYVVGKEGPSQADGFDYLWNYDPNSATVIGVFVGPNTAYRAAGHGTDAWPVATDVGSHLSSANISSTGSAMFPIATKLGVKPRFHYVSIWVYNPTSASRTFTANWLQKGN